MRLHTIGICGLALGSSLSASGWAASQGWAAPDSLLARLTREALDSAPAVRRAEALARAAERRVRPAGALPDPMLMAGVMDLTLPRFAFRESDFTEVDVEVSQALPWPGTLKAQSRAAGATARASRADLAALRREVITRVSSAYYRLRYVVAAQRVLAAQHRLLASLLKAFAGRGFLCGLQRARLAKDFDHVIVMRGGRIVEQGRYEELAREGTELGKLIAAE